MQCRACGKGLQFIVCPPLVLTDHCPLWGVIERQTWNIGVVQCLEVVIVLRHSGRISRPLALTWGHNCQLTVHWVGVSTGHRKLRWWWRRGPISPKTLMITEAANIFSLAFVQGKKRSEVHPSAIVCKQSNRGESSAADWLIDTSKTTIYFPNCKLS